MKTLILYYTFSGTSKMLAHSLAGKYDEAVVEEVKEKKERSTFKAYTLGSIQARQRKASEIHPVEYDFYEFDRVVIVMPVWAGYPAPAFNTLMKLIPAGREVELYFCSGAGTANKSEPETKKLVEQRGCVLKGCHNIKGNTVSV